MSRPKSLSAARDGFHGLQRRVEPVRDRAQRTLLWHVWSRMLEIEFVDRSVALAGKAFVSFFPLVIVVASFMPESVRTSIFQTLTHRLGMQGDALVTAKEAFATSDDVRKATGAFGLLLTFFYASSFTTALQRVYLRAWRRPADRQSGTYTRGPAWLVVMLASMAFLGALRGLLDGGLGTAIFIVVSLATTTALWWFTSWFLLHGDVRWRVLLPTGIVTSVSTGLYALSAAFWMPGLVTRNSEQFGFFGVALALVSWFSGTAICVLIGACAGPAFAEDPGPVGTFIRGRRGTLLIDGVPPSLPGPSQQLHLRDAFAPSQEG